MKTLTQPVVAKPSFDAILNNFNPVSLTEARTESLMNRVDSKFLFLRSHLKDVLEELSPDYDVLDIAGHRAQHYQNLYFDTPDFAFYRDHHNKKRNRYKLRQRHYVETDDYVWELKFKSNKGRLIKEQVLGQNRTLNIPKVFVNVLSHASIRYQPLCPSLYVTYTRIALLNRDTLERLTLDTDVQFSQPDNNDVFAFGNIVIAERKQDRYTRNSSFEAIRHAHHLEATPFSKYCIGCCLSYPVKQNNFKSILHKIRKLNDA